MKVVSACFLVAVSAAVVGDSAILVADSATLMAASATREKDAKAKWTSLGTKWCELFLVSVDQPQLGSWLDVKLQPWGVGCKVCKETGVSSPFASYSINKVCQLQRINLMKHHQCKAHKAAVKLWLKEGGCIGPSPDAAPSVSQFQELMEGFDKKKSLTFPDAKRA